MRTFVVGAYRLAVDSWPIVLMWVVLILAILAFGGCVQHSLSRKTAKPDGSLSETRYSYTDSTGAGSAAKGAGAWLLEQAQDPTTLVGGAVALALGGLGLGRLAGSLSKRREDKVWDEATLVAQARAGRRS